jgi:YHS domain-containing protein
MPLKTLTTSVLLLLAAAATLTSLGCAAATPPQSASASGGKPHAECLVCKHENDLACVDIEVDQNTPHATINGRDYYFCSDACKRECQKHPERYVARP